MDNFYWDTKHLNEKGFASVRDFLKAQAQAAGEKGEKAMNPSVEFHSTAQGISVAIINMGAQSHQPEDSGAYNLAAQQVYLAYLYILKKYGGGQSLQSIFRNVALLQNLPIDPSLSLAPDIIKNEEHSTKISATSTNAKWTVERNALLQLLGFVEPNIKSIQLGDPGTDDPETLDPLYQQTYQGLSDATRIIQQDFQTRISLINDQCPETYELQESVDFTIG